MRIIVSRIITAHDHLLFASSSWSDSTISRNRSSICIVFLPRPPVMEGFSCSLVRSPLLVVICCHNLAEVVFVKTCAACGELNGDSRTTCVKCGGGIGKAEASYRKVCPKCKATYSSSATTCETCHTTLSVYDPSYAQRSGSSSSGCAYPAVSLLIPLVGFILGFILISKDREAEGKSCIIAGVVSIVLSGILWAILSGIALG